MEKSKFLKFASVTLSIILTFQLVSGQSNQKVIIHKIGTAIATIDGKGTKLYTPTEIKNNVTFISTVDFGKIMGVKFPWSTNNRIAGGIDPVTNTSLSFRLDKPEATIDGDVYKIAVRPYTKKIGNNQYFMIPLKYSCEVFGCSVTLDKLKFLSISKPLMLPTVNWTNEGRDESRRYSVPNGTAPKGEELVSDWKLENGDEETSPIYFEDKVLFNDKTGWTCYDAKTKKQIWKLGNKSDSIGNYSLLQQLSYTQGKIISGIGPTGYEASTGKVVWQENQTNIGDCFAFGNTVLAWKSEYKSENEAKYTVFSFNTTTGAVNWKIEDFEWSKRSSWIACWKDRLLIRNQCFELSTGKKLFTIFDLPKEEFPYISKYKSFFDDNGNIIVYSRVNIYLFDGKTGKLINSRPINLGLNVAYHRSKIFAISTGASSVLCINPKTLENEWETTAEIDDHTVVIPSGYNLTVITEKQISGFGIGTGKLLWSQKTEKLLSMRKTFEYAIVDRQIYATTLDWSFQKFTYRLSVKP